MVQNINNQSPYGSITRLGANESGRVVYQVTDGTGKAAGKMSIAAKDCDVFEKSYRDIIETAPKLQKFAQTHSTPEDMKKLKKKSRWIIGCSIAIGGIVPLIKTKGGRWRQILYTALGTIAGLAVGTGISIATTTPPGAMKFAKATKNISKIDIQPVIE